MANALLDKHDTGRMFYLVTDEYVATKTRSSFSKTQGQLLPSEYLSQLSQLDSRWHRDALAVWIYQLSQWEAPGCDHFQ